MRIPLSGGLEYDILTGWRKWYCYTKKPGICKFAKNKYNRRLRRVLKHELNEQEV